MAHTELSQKVYSILNWLKSETAKVDTKLTGAQIVIGSSPFVSTGTDTPVSFVASGTSGSWTLNFGKVDASQIEGIIPLANMHSGALERMFSVSDEQHHTESEAIAAMPGLVNALSSKPEEGDTVRLVFTDAAGNEQVRLFMVVGSDLSQAASYVAYRNSVDWSSLLNVPANLTSFIANDLDANGHALITGYAPLAEGASSALAATDTVAQAVAKLEKQVAEATSTDALVLSNAFSADTKGAALAAGDSYEAAFEKLEDRLTDIEAAFAQFAQENSITATDFGA